MRRALLAVGLPLTLASVLSNCAGPIQISTDGRNFQPLNAQEISKPCSAPFRVCIMNESTPQNNSRAADFSKVFNSIAWAPSPTIEACDLGVRFTRHITDAVDVISTETGQFVAHVEGGSARNTAQALCQSLASDGLLAGKLTARPNRPTERPAATSTASGLSSADIERIVAKAVQGAAAPAAPAASFPASPAPRFSAAERPDDLAIIVGIESYSDIGSKASYAERDADAFKAYVRALGVPERNIVLLKGSKAGKASLAKNLEAWLPRMAKPSSRIYFYFSGHGAPDVKSGQAYLVPWDGDPNFLAETAYPVARLYAKLGALPAKQVLVAMDSCFSGAGGRSVLASGARPLVGKIDTGAVPAKITVLAASGSSEISGSLDDKGHGAFTYFLLDGLNAGKTTPKALNEYLTPRVQDEARRLNRDQTPQMQGDGAWSLR